MIDIVSGSNKTKDNDAIYSEMSKKNTDEEGPTLLDKEGLTLQDDIAATGTEMKETDEDTKKAFDALKKIYTKMKEGTPQDKQKLKNGIEYFKKTYKRDVYESNGELKYGSEKIKKYDSFRSLIGKARTGVLLDLKKQLPSLYDHLDMYLKMENGLIYDPPEKSLLWFIKADSH